MRRYRTWNLSAHPEPALDHPVSARGPTPLDVSIKAHQFMFSNKTRALTEIFSVAAFANILSQHYLDL
jgi:hypothetical protein